MRPDLDMDAMALAIQGGVNFDFDTLNEFAEQVLLSLIHPTDDYVYVLVRADGGFAVDGGKVSYDLDEAPTWSYLETRQIQLENGERWEVICPSFVS
jgi:hypothetical protein